MATPPKRSILITGCSQGGAGNALALEFAGRGMRVFATARSLGSINNLQEQGIETLVLDVTDPESIASLKEEIRRRTDGKLDMLFNNAGTMYEAPALEANSSRVRQMFDANVFGLFDVVAALTPLLIAAVPNSSRAPTIINVASILARTPFPFSSAYNASKAAVSAYSDTLRLEVSPLGIRVVTLFMGEVSTGLMSADNINFGPNSMYAEVEVKVKERSMSHAKASIDPSVFAQQVVDSIIKKDDTSYVWKGTNAYNVWLLNAIGPRKVFDSNMMSSAGLDQGDLRKNIYERGQKLVKDLL
ncbi:putative short-chain dehydrogenases/reductase [Ilyonectria sp. MPI-CAGE-AT-0026]|nr:putative short-chain dehydrogenases/reductase [Ilyonectria sp. MPI-CAGE-AT-0026]